jgi:ubiquinone/menaquinone biosynthesis C-methylase UbiE
LGEVLTTAARVRAQDLVLDVAAGSGNAARAAARAGARVVACDLTPELLTAGRAESGSGIDWVRGDAEDLPFLDADFDVVLSCIGVMFAPAHERSAAELLRVCRPRGRIAVLSWTPGGFVGEMFDAMRPYAAPPPPGASPPPLWGDAQHVGDLLGAGATIEQEVLGRLPVNRFAGAPREAFRTYFCNHYGPTIATYRRLADRPEDAAALDATLDALAERHRRPDGTMDWEYLLVVARRTEAPSPAGPDAPDAAL